MVYGTKSYPLRPEPSPVEYTGSITPNKSSGRPREHTLYDIVTAMLYILYEGCRWRSLPVSRRGRPCTIGFASGARWNTWRHIRRYLLTESVNNRFAVLKHAVIIDTQTVKTAAYAHRDSGYDSAKNQRTQTQYRYRYPKGSLLAVVITSASSTENACGFLVLRRLHQCYDSVRTVWCDAGFKVTLIALALSLWQITCEVISRPTKKVSHL